jgi:hypothetical protein
MKKLYIITIVIILILFAPAIYAQTPYYKSMEDILLISYNPPLSKFSFSNRKTIEKTNSLISKIDTASVYFVKDYYYLTEEEDSSYAMYKFYPDGRVFIASALDIQLTKIDTVKLDTTYGNWGMYKIEDDILIIQGWLKLVVPHYYRRRFKILPNKNLFFVRSSGGKLGFSAITRTKIKVIKKHFCYAKFDIWHKV